MKKKVYSFFLRLKYFIRDKEKKNGLLIIRDILLLWILKRGFPFYYFGRVIYRKSAGKCTNYFSTREYYSIINSKTFNNPEYNTIMYNKLVLALYCEKHKIPAPRLLGYNLKRTFYFSGKNYRINTLADLNIYFNTIFKETGYQSLFVKPQMGKGGKGAFMLRESKLEEQLQVVGNQLLSYFYVYQEVVEQHREIQKIYPNSVNTLRINTYWDGDGQMHFMETVMRFGAGGVEVDNNSSGGLYVSTHRATGRLGATAKSQLYFGGASYKVHPDTLIPFENFEIPFYREAHDLCSNLAKMLPNRLTGWDVAIGPKGPVLIEANANQNILMGEYEHGGFKKHPVYQKIWAEK